MIDNQRNYNLEEDDHVEESYEFSSTAMPPKPLPRKINYSKEQNVLKVEYDLFSHNKRHDRKNHLINLLLGSLIILIILYLINLFILKPIEIDNNNDVRSSERFVNDVWLEMDKIIENNIDYIKNDYNTKQMDSNIRIIMSEDLRWLNFLQLNKLSQTDRCYEQNNLSLFYHYCVDEHNYPLIFDENCWPHSYDLYEKLLELIKNANHTFVMNDTIQFIDKFMKNFNHFLKNNGKINNIFMKQIEIAFDFSKKVGHDCEHKSVWEKNFNLTLSSGRNEKELWELYCLNHIRFPNIISINSGKYYIPEYYMQSIEKKSLINPSNDNNLTMDENEKWTQKWMNEKFLPLYNRPDSILKKRYEMEKNMSLKYAIENKLPC